MLMHEDEDFLDHIVFSDEITFAFRKSQRNIAVHTRLLKFEFCVCAISRRNVYALLFLWTNWNIYNYTSFFDNTMKPAHIILQHDGAPSHWHNSVRDWLNEVVPNR